MYNLFYRAKDGRYLLLNTFSRARLFVDEELKEVIERGAFEGVDPSITDQLAAQGVVVESRIEELKRVADLYRERVYRPFEYEFTIIPTYDCNLRCYYCQRSKKTISHRQLQKLKRFFSSELERGDFPNVAVRIAGGEPLLHPEILFEILEDLSKIAEEHGKQFFSALATNGTLLTDNMLSRLSSVLNAVQVTFEGCRRYHDSVRYHSTGTFDQVLKSAGMIRDAGILLNMRVHVSEKNFTGLQELFDELCSSVGVGMESRTMITPAPVVGTRICPLYPSRCTETDINILPKVWEAARKCGIIISGMPTAAHEMLPCPYVTPTSVIVDPSGTLYKCLMAVTDGTCAVGSIEEGIASSDPFDMSEKALWHSDACVQCQFLPLCGGGCAWRGINAEQPDSACEETQTLFAERLKFFLRTQHPLE